MEVRGLGRGAGSRAHDRSGIKQGTFPWAHTDPLRLLDPWGCAFLDSRPEQSSRVAGDP